MKSRKRKPKQRRKPLSMKPYDEKDDAGVARFVQLAFRRAVEKTGPVVAVVLEHRR